MARGLDRITSDAVAAGASRQLRHRLALSTILAVVPFLGYGRQAYAVCSEIGVSAVYQCSDTSATETITDNNADVSTLAAPPFVVTTGGVSISGLGDIRFTDANASSITSNANGLLVISNGDDGGTEGAVTINVNSTIFASGGNGIIARNYGSGAIDVTSDGRVFGANGDGIYANNSSAGSDLTITTGAQSYAYGKTNGISAHNEGNGDLEIIAHGAAYGGGYGNGFNGIYGFNSANGGDLTITAGATSTSKGNTSGIAAVNESDGDLEVTADGTVRGYNADGIFASNSANGANLKVTTGSASDVTGQGDGIEALNDGTGGLTIIANGAVTGRTEDGIYARNGGTYLKIENAAGRQVLGASDGVDAENDGTGDLIVTANGTVTGTAGNGIEADNLGGNLTIRTGAGSIVTGGEYGIETDNDGDGDLTIRAYGKVTGQSFDGIFANNDNGANNLEVTAGAGSVVTGSRHGINALNEGNGDVDIVANGEAVGSNDAGLRAYNSANGGHLEITTGAGSHVYGGKYGINAINQGSGALDIAVNGEAIGHAYNGIRATNAGNDEDFRITTGAGSTVYGGTDGIFASQTGGGALEITVNGTVTGQTNIGIAALNIFGSANIVHIGASGVAQGDTVGIYAYARGPDITITNDGLVRNLSANSADRAIEARGGATTINNNNLLIGTVLFNPTKSIPSLDDTVNNAGLWNSANGFNEFGEGHDVVNNSGILRAADDPAGFLEETMFSNLEVFNNSGLMTLVDGLENDQLQMGGATDFVGLNGKLAVDAFLDPAGVSDRMIIEGTSSGTTNLIVNLTNPIGSSPNFVGIPVISVTGATAEGDFNIENGVLNAGFFAWDLVLDFHTHELITVGLGAGAYEFAAGITGAQDLWYQTTGTLLQRQADLRALLAGMHVTPVADFSEAIEPTPVSHVTPGLWFKGVGGYLERDQDVGNNAVTDRNQEIYAIFAGFDFGTENLRAPGDALMFGLFGGYVTSNLDFTSTNSKWDYEGPSVGAYATYLDHAFYADLTVKADFLDVDIDASDIAPADDDVDTDVLNLGGQIDTGYKMPLAHGLFVEPQASLAVVHTEIDDIDDVFGGAVDFADETSVRGRLGLRLGHELTASNQLIYSSDVTASVWEEFAGDNEVTIFAPLTPAADIADDPGETFGDVSLGFSVQSPEGWSSFLRANYQFSADYDAFAGNAGVRFAW